MSSGLSRRDFLVRTGWLAAGSTVLTSCAWLPVLPTFSDPDLESSCVWVQLLSDGRVRFYCPKSEMGQGIFTGLSQIVAEELNLDSAEIEVVAPHTGQIPPAKMTVGSFSVRELFEPLSNASALLRETLRERAARRAGVGREQIADEPGGFAHPDGSRIAYADLVGDGEVLVADPAQMSPDLRRYCSDDDRVCRQVGRPVPSVQLREIVTGRMAYARDVVVSGMLDGRVVRSPRLRGELVSVGREEALAVPGVTDVIVDRNRQRVGVVAENPFALRRGLAALSVSWRGGEPRSQADLDRELDVDRAIERDDFEHELLSEGDPSAAAARAQKQIDVRYDTSFMAHAAMEPRSGIVSVTDAGVEAWTASQDPWYMRAIVARETGRSQSDVVVHNHRLGGAFGGRSLCQATEEAAWLSSQVRRPVRVQWTREDEFQANYFQPPFSHRIRAGIGADGRVSHWLHDYTTGPILMSSAMLPAHMLWLVDLMKDPGSHQNVVPPWDVPDRRIRYSDIRLPVPTGAWRGLGAAPNTTAVECAMDELAELAAVDPIEFRMRHTRDPRLQQVLREVRRISGWERPLAPNRGRGVAATHYEASTYVAVVAEVEVRDARVLARHIFVAHDCGRVINPDQVTAQIEGCAIWGTSMTLLEHMALDDGRVGVTNFHDYPVLRHDESPEISVSLIDRPSQPPLGVGEPAIAPTPAALLAAVYAASGQRIRRLPLRQPS